MRSTTRQRLAAAVSLPLALGLLTACAGGGSGSGGGEGGGQSLSFANSYPEDHPHNRCGAVLVQEAVADDDLELEIFPSSQLGGDTDRFTSVMSGDIALDLQGSSGLAATYEPIGVMDMAYAFDDVDHLFSWFDESEAAQQMKEDFETETGAKILDVWYYGDRTFSANSPIRTPADLDNLRIRFPDSPVHLQNAEALGAEPVAVAFEEIYLALQQGTVDGQENPVQLTAQNSFDEVQDYVSLNRHSVGSQLVVMNADAWSGLSEEQQTALTEAVRDARADNLECAQTEEQEVLDEWEAAGTPEVIEDVDVEAFRTRAQDYFLNNLDGEQLELYQDIRDSAGQN
ncbi:MULTISPECIES: DctP family TRAP transporter solute-binding subunit [Kocuria]|uniref:tRNA modification GTPase n=1 Tax=Kocuria rosea subsp. polaris TaxID=136273 RepID=A0A0W8IMQ0_KOCRO|nr:DctP family TRAP transporter solute-binding subunit [Kocuria polaris]KUG61383.1 tRNA modification GTPase [Kocuria polaris]